MWLRLKILNISNRKTKIDIKKENANASSSIVNSGGKSFPKEEPDQDSEQDKRDGEKNETDLEPKLEKLNADSDDDGNSKPESSEENKNT